jgi:hypothetical protein
MDEFKGLGKPTEWADRAITPKAEEKPLPKVDVVEPVVETPKPEKAPASDMHSLASLMKKKLMDEGISVDPAKPPYVGLEADFGDCSIRFSETQQAEVKVRCYVEKGYDSVGRLREFRPAVEKILQGKCTLNEYNLETRYTKDYTHSGAGKRASTLFFGVAIRK